jgi:hypothetical protein
VIQDAVLAGIAREVAAARANGDVDLIFNVIHTLGGGTGSGLGTLLLQSLQSAYPAHIVMSTAVFPSPKVTETVVEPYNAMLSLGMMRREGFPVLAFDNEVLYDVCIRQLGITMPTFGNLNTIIAGAMVGLFAPVMAGQATALRVVHGMMQNRPLTKVNKPGFGIAAWVTRLTHQLFLTLVGVRIERDVDFQQNGFATGGRKRPKRMHPRQHALHTTRGVPLSSRAPRCPEGTPGGVSHFTNDGGR